MIDRILGFAIHNRWLVLAVVLGFAVFGVYQYRQLPIDAVPDITNVQVQINTQAAGYSPLETEQRVTFLIETAMAGLPELESTRSLSVYGLSQVTPRTRSEPSIFRIARALATSSSGSTCPVAMTPRMTPAERSTRVSDRVSMSAIATILCAMR